MVLNIVLQKQPIVTYLHSVGQTIGSLVLKLPISRCY